MQHLERGQFLDRGVAARMLVDTEVDDRTVKLLHLQRHDLVDELAVVDRGDGALM